MICDRFPFFFWSPASHGGQFAIDLPVSIVMGLPKWLDGLQLENPTKRNDIVETPIKTDMVENPISMISGKIHQNPIQMDDCLGQPHFRKPPIWTTGFSWFRHNMTKLSMVPLRLMPVTLCFCLSERAMSDHVDIEVAKLCTNPEGNRSIHRLSRYQPYQPSSSIPSGTRSHGNRRCAASMIIPSY